MSIRKPKTCDECRYLRNDECHCLNGDAPLHDYRYAGEEACREGKLNKTLWVAELRKKRGYIGPVDETMGDEVQITVIATGIERQQETKVIRLRDVTPEEAEDPWTVRVNGENLDTPTFQRIGEHSPLPEEKEEVNLGKKGIFKRAFFKDNLDYPTFLRSKAD